MTLEYVGEDNMSQNRLYMLRVGVIESARMGEEIVREIVARVSEHLAAEYLETHGAELLSHINADAVANMAIAEAGAAVNDTLKKKHAERVVRVPGEREVYQTGIFGGLRRVR
jgi:hypothetical protein